jgi:hypothetical protein
MEKRWSARGGTDRREKEEHQRSTMVQYLEDRGT